MLAQPQVVSWTFEAKKVDDCKADLVFKGQIKAGWYTYSQFIEGDDGPLPTTIEYDESVKSFAKIGKAQESGGVMKVFDKVFNMELTKFKGTAVITQRIEVKDPTKPIVGYLTFMSCDDEQCLPPRDVDFRFDLSGLGLKPCNTPKSDEPGKGATPAESGGKQPDAPAPDAPAPDAPAPKAPDSPDSDALGAASAGLQRPDDPNFVDFFFSKRESINSARFVSNCGIESEAGDLSFFGIFFGGFIGGLLALLTPCVFPMVPMTVAFFVKRSGNRKKGIRNAIIYGLSIILIYVALGIGITAAFGPNFLNQMSTDMYFNLLFFAVFVIFALSFFGLFEITLPSSWIDSSDKMADRGGLVGIFFMAFTLALVSFSCTGPIVGTLLVEASRINAGAAWLGFIPPKPAVGMFGFGLALALPFTLFALFPGWLQSLPKSGGWMDNVKITLGILELALALKFLSTADMVRHWGILKFETFLVLWILLALALGLYQLGVFGWKGAKGKPGFGRMGLGLASVAFAAYMGWGLVNYRPLSLLSGLAPPVHYSYKYDKKADSSPHKGCPHELECYHDFDEAVVAAQREQKPLFVDFTGYGCVNCRKMEENVWIYPEILDRLRNDYIVVSLYVDDQARLFPDNKFSYLLDPLSGEKIRTVGGKWSSFQINNFGASSQPYYVLMHYDGATVLNKPVAYTPEVRQYRAFLDCGLEAFKRVRKEAPESRIGHNAE
ncbi:MAG: protein-disulfide reductase DsbD family protein [Saprospiraceae bacterium]